mgnify:CR=1 FL=1
MHLQESGEMYLETIYVLDKENNGVRAVDVAEYRGYSKPSVSRAVGVLKKGGMLTVDAAGLLHLTAAARKIYERHTVMTDFLIRIGVDEETAATDACKIEHALSDTSFEAIKRHVRGEK